MNKEKWELDLDEILKSENLYRFEELESKLKTVIKKWSEVLQNYSAGGYMSRKPVFQWINDIELKKNLIGFPEEINNFNTTSFQIKEITQRTIAIDRTFYFSFHIFQNLDNPLIIKYYFNQIPVNYYTFYEDASKGSELLPNNKSEFNKIKELIVSGKTDAQSIFEDETILLDILNSSLKTFLMNSKKM